MLYRSEEKVNNLFDLLVHMKR